MSDRFQPLTMEQLTAWVFTELDTHQSVFGIPQSLFFTPKEKDPFRTALYGATLETPFGVAAGPHTQMAQNIIAAWLCGARFIELKTIQTLDELNVPKPCIDMQDEGYNVEWSQELKIKQSFDEYLRAWILIHALHRRLGFPGQAPGMIFNMSVGYNYEGVLKENVQWFLRNMQDAGALHADYIREVGRWFPDVESLNIPRKLSDNVTLSTMHGCPPAEIGKIAAYLIEEWGFHTNVKLNPTLLGPDPLRSILNETLGFDRVTVPDEAFGHDLKYPDALLLLKDLQTRADRKNVTFGVKLSNTLECENHRDVFNPAEKMMYMSGRPLLGVTVNLAAKLSAEFGGKLLMSYAGGADAFHAADLLASGMCTITASSDLLKSGGYMRMLQYVDETRQAMKRAKAASLPDFITRSAGHGGDPSACALQNLQAFAKRVLQDPRLKQEAFDRQNTKTSRPLSSFDCIKAPCSGDCPIHQNVPRYMQAVKDGDFSRAIDLVRDDNPMPSVLGRACTHVCEQVCVRSHYDEPLAIREIKRFIMDQESNPRYRTTAKNRKKTVAIVGAGPCGLGAAYFLRQAGFPVTLYEERPYPGGMVQGTIPGYRATQAVIDQDMNIIRHLGADIRTGQKAGRDFQVADLLKQYTHVIVAAGAQKSMAMKVPGENARGVYDCLDFLRKARHSEAPALGRKVGVVGGGDVAMDCARTAKRLTGGHVQVIYRRTKREMPAEPEEIRALQEEGIEIIELAAPVEVKTAGKNVSALRCIRMELGEPDASGRRRPVPVAGSEFDIPLDSLIVAIGQQPDFSFLGDLGVKLNEKGYLDVNETTLETTIPNLFAGGDAVQSGPTTIVKAFGDGKLIAQTILQRDREKAPPEEPAMPVADWADMIARRAVRRFRVPVEERPADQREGFNEVIQTLSNKQARREAERCLGCDTFCSLCATVCPNRAIQTYRCEPIARDVPEVKLHGAVADVVAVSRMRVAQPYQIVIQTDFCNECGNCRTFCPTAGAPYQQKPRLYMQPAEFAAEKDNAFMLIRKNGQDGIRGKYNGELSELTLTEKGLSYSANMLRLTLKEKTFEVLDAAVEMSTQGGDHHMSLAPCFEMYVLLKNIRASLPGLPVYTLK